MKLNIEKRAENEISCLRRPIGDFRRVLSHFSTGQYPRTRFFLFFPTIYRYNNTRFLLLLFRARELYPSFYIQQPSSYRSRRSYIFDAGITRLVNVNFCVPPLFLERGRERKRKEGEKILKKHRVNGTRCRASSTSRKLRFLFT